MHVDLITLYLLAIGTLLASAGMTLWERRSCPKRGRELQTLAAGYATLAIGCAAASARHALPGALGSGLSNFVILTGYLLVMNGVALLNGRRYGRTSAGLLIVTALTWAIAGARWQELIWNYASAMPIAITCALTSRELLRGDGIRRAQSRDIAAIVSGVHALCYAARACVLPWAAPLFGPAMLSAVAKFTMYEGVLYSVVLPMTLLRLVRDEAHGDLLHESQTDYLTGLRNRRWFFEEGSRIVRELGASRPVSVLAIDIDRFKTINDRYGHVAGDEVLKSFAQVARSVLGAHAILARIGGEEFAALFSAHDRLEAHKLADAVVTRFARTINRIDGAEIRATISGGLAQSQGDATGLADLLAHADEALYRAKSRGGNRLEVAQPAAFSRVERHESASLDAASCDR